MNALRRLAGNLLMVAMVLPMAAPAPAADRDRNPLRAERWKTRPVIVVVPTADHALLRKVQAALQQTATREAFIERQMVLYTVAAGAGRRNDVPLRPGETRALLAALKLDAAGPPSLVLVGLDGGVKLREGPDVALDAVFAEIDRMPMRRDAVRVPRP